MTVPAIAAALGLIRVVIGGLALARSAGRIGIGPRRVRALVALVLGLVSAVTGGLHSANSAGGFGTGNGLAGALVALITRVDRHGHRWAGRLAVDRARSLQLIGRWLSVDLGGLGQPGVEGARAEPRRCVGKQTAFCHRPARAAG